MSNKTVFAHVQLAALILLTQVGCNTNEQTPSASSIQPPSISTEEETPTENTSSSLEPELDALVNNLLSREYLHQGFTKINETPYPSDVSDNKLLDVYVNNEAANPYSLIDPNTEDSFSDLSQGDVIIREVWSESQQLEKYTVMIKMERGYFPEGGDFLYATINTDGSIENNGKLNQCAACHLPRENDGYLFGVPSVYHEKNDTNSAVSHEQLNSQHLEYAKQVIQNRRYLDEEQGFVQVNQFAFPSALNDNNMINTFISETALEDYESISPDDEGSLHQVATGTVIVREVTDAFTNERSHTVMIKSLPGYFPEGGDFYYAVLDDDGNLKSDEQGQQLSGKIDSCGRCHLQRKDDGYLFGISDNLK